MNLKAIGTMINVSLSSYQKGTVQNAYPVGTTVYYLNYGVTELYEAEIVAHPDLNAKMQTPRTSIKIKSSGERFDAITATLMVEV